MAERYLLSNCCETVLDLSAAGEEVCCPACGKQYAIREELDFAEYSSGSYVQHKWSADGDHIVRYYFHNMTLEQLEGVAEQIKLLSLKEKRPHVLLPVCKSLHDCLKKRLQHYLAEDSTPVLTVTQKALIEIDEPTQSLRQLVELLIKAHPAEAHQIRVIGMGDHVRALMWLRNKGEHLAVSAWPINSYVHAERDKLPSDPTSCIGVLGTDLLIEMNNCAIDLLTLIYDLCPADVRPWHYERLNDYRLHKTV